MCLYCVVNVTHVKNKYPPRNIKTTNRSRSMSLFKG